MSQLAARDMPTKIARYAHYDGPILSIDTSDNFLERMEVRNGSHGLHLDLQTFEIWRFPTFRPDDNNVTASNPYSVWVGRSSEKRLKSR